MRRADQVALLGGFGIGLLALHGRGLAVGVELDRHRRVRELHRRDVHQVAPQHQLLALAFDDVDAVPRRVPGCRDRLDAGHELGAAVEGLELACRHIGVQRGLRALEEALRVGRGLLEVRGAEPEIGVVLVGAHHRIREHRLVARHQAADVVGVHVGDVDLVDLLRLVAGRFQARQQVAERRAEQAGGAGVDQHQLRAGVDEVAVDRGLDRRLQEAAREPFADLRRAGVGQQLVDRQRDRAVGQRGDFEVTQHHPVVAGLGLDLWRRGVRRAEQESRAGDGGEAAVQPVRTCHEVSPQQRIEPRG